MVCLCATGRMVCLCAIGRKVCLCATVYELFRKGQSIFCKMVELCTLH